MSTVKKVLLKILGPLILSKSKIVSNERLSPHFQLITIKGSSFKKADWTPGQKIQVRLANDETRSYTPSSWDKKAGIVQTLVYMHGKGPGALWARDAKPLANVTVLGPRASLLIAPEEEAMVFFGDETTFGLAHALKDYLSKTKTYFIFEATDINESKPILEKFALKECELLGLNECEKVADFIFEKYQQGQKIKIVLSGKQQSIVKIRDLLYSKQVPAESIIVKVYWGWKDDPKGKLKSR